MSSVIVYSAAHIDGILDLAVTNASITAGHLILTLGDGSTIDVGTVVSAVPDASTVTEGIVELATDVETIAGTDAVRAVTPFGLKAVVATSSAKGLVELATNAETIAGTDTTRAVTPASLLSAKVIVDPGETALPSAYPAGVSVFKVSASTWSLNGGSGAIVTTNEDNSTAQQVFLSNAGGTLAPQMWIRQYHPTNGAGGWTAWRECVTLSTTAPVNGDVIQRVSGAWSNQSPTQLSSSLGFIGMPVVNYSSGSGYAAVNFPAIYVGPTDPASGSTVVNGSIWFDTTGA